MLNVRIKNSLFNEKNIKFNYIDATLNCKCFLIPFFSLNILNSWQVILPPNSFRSFFRSDSLNSIFLSFALPFNTIVISPITSFSSK